MSADTKAAVETAIEAHIADECDGDMAGAWIILAETTTLNDIDNDRSTFYIDTRNNQSRFLTDGILHAAIDRHGWGDIDDD